MSDGLACVIKGKGVSKTTISCDTESIYDNNTAGWELLSNIIKLDFKGEMDQTHVKL